MKKLFLGFCFASVLISCKKTPGPEGPQGPAGPPGSNSSQGTGIIQGKVKQYDQYRVQYTSNLNTTTVSVEGTTISTVTDANGSYSLTNVPAGVYDITYNRPNSGLNKHNQIAFPGNGTMFLNRDINDKASYLFTDGYIKDTIQSSGPLVLMRLYYASEPKAKTYVLIFGKTSSLDISNPSTYEIVSVSTLPANSNTYNQYISPTSYNFNSFQSGETIYAKVYPYSDGGYYDYVIEKEVLTGTGTPLAGTFTLTKP